MHAARCRRFASVLVYLFSGLVLLLVQQAVAQQAVKRPLTHDDYDRWRSIQSPQISRDGKYVAYVLGPVEGDAEVVVRNVASGVERRHNVGSRDAATSPAAKGIGGKGKGPIGVKGPAGAAAAVPGGSRVAFSPDNRFLVFQISPGKKAKGETSSRTSLGIMELASGKVIIVPSVRSFQMAEDSGDWLLARRDTGTPTAMGPTKSGTPTPKSTDTKKRTRTYGSDLVLRNLTGGREQVLRDVLEYTLTKDGKLLLYAISSKEEDKNGLFMLGPGQAGPPLPILTGRGQYVRLTWDEEQTQLAFFSDRDEHDAAPPRFRLYHWQRSPALAAATQFQRELHVLPMWCPIASPGVMLTWGVPAAIGCKDARACEVLSSAAKGVPAGMSISDKAPISFSVDGGKIFLGVAPPEDPSPLPKGEGSKTEEKAVVELWHWKDEYIQPMQKVKGGMDRNRIVRSVLHLTDKRFVALSDKAVDDIRTFRSGTWALGADDRPYRRLVGFDANYSDFYLVNLLDGTRKPLLTKHVGSPVPSPGGKYLIFHDGKDWLSHAVADGKVTNLTRDLGVKFTVEDYDSPSTAPPYGLAGWTEGDKQVILYDKYDLWLVAPDGSGGRNLTQGVGRKEQIQLRRVVLDPRAKFIDLGRPMLLRADNLRTRDTGFYRLSSTSLANGRGPPEQLLMAARAHGTPTKAKDADALLLTVSTFYDGSDLHVVDMDFRNLQKVSHANPQKDQFVWGKAELVRFKNADGVPLSGVLIKPENFDPKKKYPMLVYIYEKLSQNLHNFVDPKPGTSINASYYVSNGYLVFMPDIVYTVGYPGQSALKCVLPGIQAVVDMGCVDENAIGIQGHSWGGYQIAYMITQTKRFRAVSAGAPVANMTSAYDGIRWGSGLPRQFQYERTQSRIGGSLWQYPMRFVENSPVFMADRVHTPIMILHNDQDDAVPWYQGIEYYLALRRLGKEVYLFNYPGEFHGLRKRVNQRDYTVRMQQFFDHYLKGAPRPDWMENGIPYRGRGRETPPATSPDDERGLR